MENAFDLSASSLNLFYKKRLEINLGNLFLGLKGSALSSNHFYEHETLS